MQHGMMPEPEGSLQRAVVQDLLEGWYLHSGHGSGVPEQVWCGEAARELVEAGVEGRAPRGPLQRFAQDRARLGMCLAEVLSEIDCLCRLLGPVRSASVDSLAAATAVAEAWDDALTQALPVGVTCLDPLTGLSTADHLATRLQELYAQAELLGVRATGTHSLVIAEVELRAADPFERASGQVGMAELISRWARGGERPASMAAGRVAVLADRDDHLPDRVAELRRRLEAWANGQRRVAIWVEPLPSARDQIPVLFAQFQVPTRS